MKRKRVSSFVVAALATVCQVAVPIPGCESLMLDPQAFFEENTCNIFNCDTLFFLQGNHIDDEHDELVDEHDEIEAVEAENHTHD